ncbi:MAG TPA: hypothetical protein EYO33_18070 [Phycisphaerales bacterium]|nr:hypothetical protein [Phycisphaerales bacterium]
MKKWMKLMAVSAALFAVVGCSGSPDAGAQPSDTPAAQATAAPEGDKVTVAADGSKFDPPVPVEKIPNGAWACVMDGKVHYASAEKGEGKCVTCGMNLVEVGK